jgi:CHASE2 domain-containing sensor protein
VPRHLLPQVFTVTGIVVICLGLLVPFLDIYSLFSVFIPAIGIGVALAFVGSVVWSLRIARARRRQLLSPA